MNRIDEALYAASQEEWRKQVRRHRPVIADIVRERMRQDRKFGPQQHPPLRWLGILAEEFGEASRGALETDTAIENEQDPTRSLKNLRDELIQVAAVAVAWVEDWDDREIWPTG